MRSPVSKALILSLWYLFHAPPNVKVWHKAFFWWVRVQGRSHMRPAFPKNAYGPVGIPLIRGTSGAGRSPPPDGGNNLGGRPPAAVGKIQLPRHTRPDPRRSQHGGPKCDRTIESAKSCSYKKQLFTFSSALVLVATADGLVHCVEKGGWYLTMSYLTSWFI